MRIPTNKEIDELMLDVPPPSYAQAPSLAESEVGNVPDAPKEKGKINKKNVLSVGTSRGSTVTAGREFVDMVTNIGGKKFIS